ncbi:uncharacterized protein LOC112553707 isoform X1 [Pomacea canaliculata]|uniref:uncharacterized protein LOC112553707 isoform X1 n=1 Tax=Pomacea canaliculata TaxID=400727 RepID=UPI000D72FED4|nr:uncharacterized protein LOC112553707 isoform X1 [Pomacea canaliculata]
MEYNSTQHVCLHAGWLQYKASQREWKSVWAVLKDGIIFLFHSEITTLENHIGTLRLDQNSSVQFKDDKKHACKFEIHTSNKKNIFKVTTPYERELWRAYLTGVFTGIVSGDFILSPRELQEIQRKINQVRRQPDAGVALLSPPIPQTDAYNQRTSPAPTSLNRNSVSQVSKRSDSSGSTASAEFDPPLPNISPADFNKSTRSSISECDSLDLNSGGPFMRHKFYTDGRNETPSWFFPKCSPELAERILKSNPTQGNTLMRLSSRDLISGSYAISKCMKRTGEVLHYEIIRVAEGYKIKVQNEHSPMKCLSEVMSFFQKMSGEATTFPLKTNSLQELGIDEPHYADFIRPPSCQMIDKNSSISSYEQDGVYEEPLAIKGDLSEAFPPPPPPICLSESDRQSLSQVSQTWSSRKNELSNAGRGLPKTMSNPKPTKPSEMRTLSDIQLQMQTDSNIVLGVIKDFDDQLEKISLDDLPPPLPEIPKDRPKLNLNQPIYANDDQSTKNGNGPVNTHPRYSQRSMSMPMPFDTLPSFSLESKVIANTKPPMVTPEGKRQSNPRPGLPLQTSQSFDQGVNGTNIPVAVNQSHFKLDSASPVPLDVPARRTSLPLPLRPTVWHRFRQRWTSQKSSIPLPLPPDISDQIAAVQRRATAVQLVKAEIQMGRNKVQMCIIPLC